MENDKFFDIVNKLKRDEQIANQNDSVSLEGLRDLNEGLKNSNFSLEKTEGHSIGMSFLTVKSDE